MGASENFWRMPTKKSEDLRSKPQDFFKKKIAQPAPSRHFPRERIFFL